MKSLLDQLDKVLDHRVRLAAVTLLMVDDKLDFGTLKTHLAVSDGSLSAHMAALEKAGYIAIEKRFKGKRPLTEYRLTAAGRTATSSHLAALEALLKHAPAVARKPPR